MLLSKLKITACCAAIMLLTGLGATSLTYRATAQQPKQGVAVASQPQADELEALRLEMEALRKEVRAMRERVKALEGEMRAMKDTGGGAGSRGGRGGSYGSGGAGGGPPGTQPPAGGGPSSGFGPPGAQPPGGGRTNRFATEPAGKQPPRYPTSGPEKPDPLAEAEAALKQLRSDPTDKQAAEALEKALKRLKEREGSRQPAGADPRLKH
jgi:hypothetical protein